MADSLKVVILQRAVADAECIVSQLRLVEPNLVAHIVDTFAAYQRHLRSHPDIIIADCTQVGMNGDPTVNDALLVARQHGIAAPFIVVAVPEDEDCALDLMRRGATDYVLLDRLARLGPLVERLVAETREYSGYREEHDWASALSDIAAILNQTLEFDTVIERILVTVGRVLPHDAANVMLIEDNHVYVIGHRGYVERGLKKWIEDLWWSLDKVVNLKAEVETRQPLAVPDARNFKDWYDEPGSSWVGSIASAPIILDNKVIGFLNLDKAEANFYTQQHAERLMAFANHASVAIRNAQLYDIVQRHAAEMEQRMVERTSDLRKSEARYRAIVQDQTELIVRYLPDWTVTFVNRACCRYYGTSTSALVGRSFLDLIDETERPAIANLLRTLTIDDPVRVVEHRFYKPQGEMTWLQWTNRMVFDPQGGFLEYQAVGRDITERRKAEELLRKSLVREIQLGEMKSRFVSLVSHEFRNPLAVVMMNNDMLWRYYDRLAPDRREEYVASTRAHIKSMTDLLDDLLMISQSEAGKLDVRPEPLNLSDLTRRVIDDIWTTNGADRQCDFMASEVCDAVTDPKLYRLIVTNLVSNATKYTAKDGRIEIRLLCDEDRIIFRISDNGIGIPEPEQVQLFETFHRASNVGSVPGTGLGLAMVKQCVELLGGVVTFESRQNFGTTFTVSLPRVSALPPTTAD